MDLGSISLMAGSYPDGAAPVNGRPRLGFPSGPAYAPASHPSGLDRTLCPAAFHTATATAFLRPAGATGRLPRATPAPRRLRLRSRIASCCVSIEIAGAGELHPRL